MRQTGLLLIFWCAAFGQAAAPAFDVATVKLPGPREPLDIRTSPGGRLTVTNLRLKDVISQAYGVKYYQISGGPAWLDTERFDIEAKAEGDPSHDLMMRMLQTLLEDRFQLKVHREMKEGAVYTLTVSRGGSKLTEAAPLKDGERANVYSGRTGSGNAPAISYWKQGRRASMAMLATALEETLHRPVQDQTGIKGDFDFKFEYAADETNPGEFPSLFTAIQEQLGLRLESAKGPVEMLVVERAEKPSGN
jgi:uncharacterized protein (TIGR03435 family)